MSARPEELVAEIDYGADMVLAAGVTCANCAHIRRCEGLGFTIPEATSCDFWPNRFRAKRAARLQGEAS